MLFKQLFDSSVVLEWLLVFILLCVRVFKVLVVLSNLQREASVRGFIRSLKLFLIVLQVKVLLVSLALPDLELLLLAVQVLQQLTLE